jgi:hypothetical protein
LIAVVERELCRIKADDSMLTTRAAIKKIFEVGQHWLDVHPVFQRRGRLSLEYDDGQLLLALRAAHPSSDCWKEFCQSIGPHLSVARQRFRYKRACRYIEMK